MSLPAGTRLGPYEIVAPLGAGGMGDVYRGRDTRLERSVAIKVLSAHLATDSQFRLRFEREARAISSLEHPNICTLFDVGEQGSISYLVMPLLDGETLADRLSAPGGHDRALPVRDALRIAIEIASAIEAAHEHGIIHRDLKPANIFVLRDGTAKILDFGLAKDSRSASSVATHETTIAEAIEPGIILGTAAYMAPEQVRGLSIDKRTDIWAFGCVLYQMLAGRRPFAGQTPSDIMAAILEREPDWTALPPSLPDGVVRVLRRCLRKDTRDRLHDIADARIEIQDARDQPESAPAAATPPSPRRRERLFLVVAVAATVAALGLGAARLSTPRAAQLPEARLDIVTPPTADPTSMAISPDGRTIAFVASTNGAQRIWLRRLDGTAPRELMGTENGTLAFWSPDGRSLGFFTADKLKRIDLAGGVARSLADVAPGVGGTWGSGGTILFARTLASALYKVPAEGGDQAFNGSVSRIAVRRFPGPGREWIVSTGGIYPRWSADGQELYYVRGDGTLMAATIHERGDDLDIGTPVALFKTGMVGGGTNVVGRRQQYDVGSDGRFLINVALSEVTPAPITVIVNWQPQ